MHVGDKVNHDDIDDNRDVARKFGIAQVDYALERAEVDSEPVSGAQQAAGARRDPDGSSMTGSGPRDTGGVSQPNTSRTRP